MKGLFVTLQIFNLIHGLAVKHTKNFHLIGLHIAYSLFYELRPTQPEPSTHEYEDHCRFVATLVCFDFSFGVRV